MRKASSGAILALAVLISGCGGDGNGDGPPMGPPGTGAIQGSIRDDVNDPVAGAVARLRNRGSTTNVASQTTDAAGSYIFSAVDPGDYDIFLELPTGFELNGQANPVVVSVTADQTASVNFTIRLAVFGTISGSAAEGMNPIQNATASLRSPGSTAELRATTTNAAGQYTFTRVAIGGYDVFLIAPTGLAVDPPNPVSVTVSDGGTSQADFSLSVAPVSFSTQIQPIFNSNCAFSGCHGGANANPASKPMFLTAGQAYSNIVNVSAAQLPSMDRIEPGDPANSYLIHKIEGTAGTVGGSNSSRMPLGAGQLPQATIDLMKLWVTEGAQNN